MAQSLLQVAIKQSLGMLREEDAILLLTDLLKQYPSVVTVDIIYAKDLHRMAEEKWVDDGRVED